MLAALAARVTKRPVKLVLTRAQMFTSVGHRPNTIQQLSHRGEPRRTAHRHCTRLKLLDRHGGRVDQSDHLRDPQCIRVPQCVDACTQIRQSIPIPGWMRAPGEAEGSFALESAMDELAYAVGIDPIELRVKNHAHVHPGTGLPWSSNALLDCYRQGAERFGWSARTPEPRSMRSGLIARRIRHGPRSSGRVISLHATLSHRYDEMERRSCAAARPISGPAPTP